MDNIIVGEKVIDTSIEAIREAIMDVRMSLEQKQQQLNFSFQIWCFVNGSVNCLYLLFNVDFGGFITSFHEWKYPIQPFDWVQKQSWAYVFLIGFCIHELDEKMIEDFEQTVQTFLIQEFDVDCVQEVYYIELRPRGKIGSK